MRGWQANKKRINALPVVLGLCPKMKNHPHVKCTPKVRQTLGGAYFYGKKRSPIQKVLAKIQNNCYNGYARESFELLRNG